MAPPWPTDPLLPAKPLSEPLPPTALLFDNVLFISVALPPPPLRIPPPNPGAPTPTVRPYAPAPPTATLFVTIVLFNASVPKLYIPPPQPSWPFRNSCVPFAPAAVLLETTQLFSVRTPVL